MHEVREVGPARVVGGLQHLLERRVRLPFQPDAESGEDCGMLLGQALRDLDLGERFLGSAKELLVVVHADSLPPCAWWWWVGGAPASRPRPKRGSWPTGPVSSWRPRSSRRGPGWAGSSSPSARVR